MKLLSLGMLFSILTASFVVHAGNTSTVIADACFKDVDLNRRVIIGRVTVFTNRVYLTYKTPQGQSIVGYHGMIPGTPQITAGGLKISDMTLNDYRDGWLDHMDIEITKTTVKAEQKGSKKRPSTIIPCP